MSVISATAAWPNSSKAGLFLADPMAKMSWFLDNSNMSKLKIGVESVWGDYTGKNVKIGVVDSQIDFRHADLKASYSSDLDYNFSRGTGEISLLSTKGLDAHGTMVAGVIAAEGGNGVGGVGIAANATLVGLGIDYSSASVVEQAVAALRSASKVDVVNNSWSFSRNFDDNFSNATNAYMGEALKFVAETGREGLGTAIVFAAGNAGTGGSSNYHNFQNSPYSIAVGAVEANGSASSFTSVGANVLVSAAGSNVFTTSINDKYTMAYGTSFAAPAVSAVIGLMLEANPHLGYRDIQQILALSARREGLGDGPAHADGWQINGATNHNGGGMHFNDAFGYGFVNAHDAVRLAETWTLQQTAANRASASVTKASNTTLLAGSNDHISVAIKVDAAMLTEHVQLSMRMSWQDADDLDVYLTSPEGTVVRLLYDMPGEGTHGMSFRNFAFSSVASMGESSAGTWRLDIHNRNPDAAFKSGAAMNGHLHDVTLTVHGRKEALANDTYFFTNEFGTLYRNADLQARQKLVDLDGGVDAINAAAVTTDSTIDLSGRIPTMIAGVAVNLAGARIENVYAGDGNDRLRGNDADNILNGGRGNDVFHYTAGSDVLLGGAGQDSLVFEQSFKLVSTFLNSAGEFMIGFATSGYSLVKNVEAYIFVDVTYSMAQMLEFLTTGNQKPTVDNTPVGSIPEAPEAEPVTTTPLPVAPSAESLKHHVALRGTEANDRLNGKDLRDAIDGGGGHDKLFGNGGDDVVYGRGGDDLVYGGVGDDWLEGGAGRDTMYGDDGADVLLGGDGADVLRGRAGDDVLIGGLGADELDGDGGADTFVFDLREADSRDTIVDFNVSEGDRIIVTGMSDPDSASFELLRQGRETYLEVTTELGSFDLASILGLGKANLAIVETFSDGFILA